MRQIAALIIVLLGVSACEVAVGGANLVSVIYTEKTLLGHAVGAATGQDCSLLNIEKKEPFCQEWAQQDDGAVVLYCYPTLGRPECFETSLPNEQGRVSIAAPNPETWTFVPGQQRRLGYAYIEFNLSFNMISFWLAGEPTPGVR